MEGCEMSIYKRGDVWWFCFVFAGQRIRESTKTANKALARQVERKRHQQIVESLHGVKKRQAPKRFSVAAAEWLEEKEPVWSDKSYTTNTGLLKHLGSHFNDLLLIDITAADISAYQKRRRTAGASAKTINHEVGALRAILIKARLWEEIKPDVSMLRVDETVGKALTKAEEQRLIQACAASRSKTLLPFVQMALHTGLRKHELTDLTWAQVDLLRQEIRVGRAKSVKGSNRIVPLNAQALGVLQNWMRNFEHRAPEDFVFPTVAVGHSGNERKPYQITVDQSVAIGDVKSAWGTAKYKAGVEVRFHDLRHTCATRLLERGASLSVVASIFGWSPSTLAAMSLRYGHISSDATRKALDSLVEPAGVSDTGDDLLLSSRN